MTIYVKTVLWQNPDLHIVRTNQDVHIYQGTTLPSNNTIVCNKHRALIYLTTRVLTVQTCHELHVLTNKVRVITCKMP